MVVEHYSALIDAIRARVAELNISHETLDQVCGLPAGYASKILSNPPVRRLAAFLLFPVLQTLGLQVRLADDPDALDRVRHRLPRKAAPFRMRMRGRGKHKNGIFYLSPDLQKIRGRNGGLARAKKLSSWRRKRIAKRAARIRWQRSQEIPSSGAASGSPGAIG